MEGGPVPNGSWHDDLVRSFEEAGLYNAASDMQLIIGEHLVRGPSVDPGVQAASTVRLPQEPLISSRPPQRARLLETNEGAIRNAEEVMHRLSRIVSDVDAQVGRATDGATESIAQALAHMHADTTGQGEAHLGRRGGGNGGGVGGAPRVAADRGKGLRHFSSRVCAKVEERGRTTYNEVADDLVTELRSEAGNEPLMMDEKNIRRRVYDALNVLMAMEIIAKERKEIYWRGLPASTEEDLERMRDDCRVKAAQLDKKRAHLSTLLSDYHCLRALVRRNASQPAVPPESRLHTPFVLLYTMPQGRDSAEVPVIEMSDDGSEVLFDFKGRAFQMVYDKDLIQKMGLTGAQRPRAGDDDGQGGAGAKEEGEGPHGEAGAGARGGGSDIPPWTPGGGEAGAGDEGGAGVSAWPAGGGGDGDGMEQRPAPKRPRMDR